MAFISGALLTLGTVLGLGATGLSVFVGAGMFLLKTAVGVGLNLLAQAIAGKPQDPKFSVNGNLQAGGDIPRSIVLGYTATAGSLVYANTWGRAGETNNAFLTQVIALSDYPVRELREVWVNGELCTLGDTPHADYGYPVEEYQNHLWVKFYDGTQTAADPFLVSTVSSSERPYAATRVGRGVAYAVVTSLVTKNLFSGIPSFKFALHGAKLYDPSQDSTVGGSGAHRAGDPSTWGGDGDFLPAVQIYNLLRGLTYGGEWLYGVQGMSSARLPAAHWIAQINKCRALISAADGSEPTYRAGGEIGVDAPLGDAIEALLTSCQGRMTEAGGIYKLYGGAPGAAVASFTDGDILSTDEQSFTPFFGLADTINGISARYPSPDEGWNSKVAPPLHRPELEALAGNRRLMAVVSLDFVPYAEQVQRLMKSALEEAQRARRHTFVLPPQYWVLEPGDIVSWTSERNGYITKLFRVDGVVDRANLDVVVDLTEVDPSDYDWNSSTEFQPPVDGSVGPVRPTPQPIVDWYAEPWQLEDANGSARRPAIRLAWNGQQPDVDAVSFEVALAETLEIVVVGRTDEVTAASVVVSQSLLPNEDYLARGRYVSDSGREMVWSSWLPVTTPDIKLGPEDIYLEGVVEEAQEFVSEATEWIGPGLRELIDDARRLAASLTSQDFANYRDKQQLRVELKSSYEQVTAEYQAVVSAATGPGSAIVQRLETLEVEMPGKASASAVVLLSSRIDEVEDGFESISEAVTSLNAAYGDVSASANLRMSASAGPSGYAARIGFEARAGGAGAYRAASLFLDVPSSTGDPTRIVLVGDQVVLTNGAQNRRPFVFQGSTLYLDAVVVEWAKITNVEITTAQIASARIQWAQIDNVSITSAVIGSATILEGNIASGAITSDDNMTAGTTSVGGSWTQIGSPITVQSPSGKPVNLYYSWAGTMTQNPSGTANMQFRIVRNGTTVIPVGAINGGGSGSIVSGNNQLTIMDVVSVGPQTYVLQAIANNLPSNPTASGSMIAECNKR